MAKCKRCGKEQFLRKGLCYKCYHQNALFPKEKKAQKKASYRDWEKELEASVEEHNKKIDSQLKDKKDLFKVLLLDDEEGIAKSFFMILEQSMSIHYIKWCINGDVAIKMLEQEPFDFFITDRNHPGMKGEEVLEKIKGLYPTMPRIMITAYGSPNTHERVINAGAMEYLQKPFTMDSIIDLVNRAKKKIEQAKHPGGNPK